MKYPKVLQSSANPENLSLTIKGILLALVPAIIIIARGAGVELTETDLIQVIEAITVFISTFCMVFGLLRKLKNKFQK